MNRIEMKLNRGENFSAWLRRFRQFMTLEDSVAYMWYRSRLKKREDARMRILPRRPWLQLAAALILLLTAIHLLICAKRSVTQKYSTFSRCGSRRQGLAGSCALVVEVALGIGNRLRAYASASSYAKLTNRALVLIWRKDEHVQADFGELFEVPSDIFGLYTTVADLPFIIDDTWLKFDEVRDGRAVLPDFSSKTNIFLRTAYGIRVANARISKAQLSEVLKQLVPARGVQQKIDSAMQMHGRFDDAICVHIRTRIPSQGDVPGIDKDSTLYKRMVKGVSDYRNRCSYLNFLKTISKDFSHNLESKSFFVAADTKDTIESFRREFPKQRVFNSTAASVGCISGENSRSRSCVMEALTDLYLLSECKILYKSTWSSFSDIAELLGSSKTVVRTGCDPAKF